MQKVVSAAVAAIALMAAPVARADTFLPAGTTFVFTGTVVFVNPVSMTCTLTIAVASDAAGANASITAAVFTGGSCPLMAAAGLPWGTTVSAPPPPPAGAAATKLTIGGMRLVPPFGGACGPDDIEVTWTPGAPPTITLVAGTDVNPPTPGCKLSGTLQQTAAPWLAITN